MFLIRDVRTLEPLMHTWVGLTIVMLRHVLIYPLTFEYIFPALVAVLAARTFKTVCASFRIKPPTDTLNGVKC
jgi:hypothetical protein